MKKFALVSDSSLSVRLLRPFLSEACHEGCAPMSHKLEHMKIFMLSFIKAHCATVVSRS